MSIFSKPKIFVGYDGKQNVSFAIDARDILLVRCKEGGCVVYFKNGKELNLNDFAPAFINDLVEFWQRST